LSAGIIFQFKRYSIHDGPGIRTTVFLKGCPLSCSWCHNPESRSIEPQLALFPSRCIECGICAEACPDNAIDLLHPVQTDRNRCTVCGYCTELCPAAAREIIGRKMSSTEVIRIIERDTAFYMESGGGVTFSGGEPLMQCGFLEEMLSICRDRGISTAVDTSCHAASKSLARASELADLMLCDIKLVDEDSMQGSTGVSGRLILDNIRMLSDIGANIRLRMPVVPGITDTENNLADVASFIRSLKTRPDLELLPFHSTWIEKFRRLGLESSPNTPAYAGQSLAGVIEYFTDAGIRTGSED